MRDATDTTDTATRYRITIAGVSDDYKVTAVLALRKHFGLGLTDALTMLREGRVGDSRIAFQFSRDDAEAMAQALNSIFAAHRGTGQPFRTSEAP
jgi:hypothetical protein